VVVILPQEISGSVFLIKYLIQVSIFVKAFKDQIDIPKNRIHDEEKNGNTTRWLMRDDSSHADVVAHKHGVVCYHGMSVHEFSNRFNLI